MFFLLYLKPAVSEVADLRPPEGVEDLEPDADLADEGQSTVFWA